MGVETQVKFDLNLHDGEGGVLCCFPGWEGLIKPNKFSSDEGCVLQVRERNMYKLKGQPIRAKAQSSTVIENKEQAASMVEQLRGCQP